MAAAEGWEEERGGGGRQTERLMLIHQAWAKKKWDQEMKEHEAEMRMSKNMLICIQ